MLGLMQDVRAFHQASGTPVLSAPRTGGDVVRFKLRRRLITEECGELVTALTDALDSGHVARGDVDAIADGLADLIYVCVGTALELGIPLDRVWAEVQRSNMAKAVGVDTSKRTDGKVLKPKGWTPPNIDGAVWGE
jgi:predicted HAD superfamily Cof-like phosphohydrolase